MIDLVFFDKNNYVIDRKLCEIEFEQYSKVILYYPSGCTILFCNYSLDDYDILEIKYNIKDTYSNSNIKYELIDNFVKHLVSDRKEHIGKSIFIDHDNIQISHSEKHLTIQNSFNRQLNITNYGDSINFHVPLYYSFTLSDHIYELYDNILDKISDFDAIERFFNSAEPDIIKFFNVLRYPDTQIYYYSSNNKGVNIFLSDKKDFTKFIVCLQNTKDITNDFKNITTYDKNEFENIYKEFDSVLQNYIDVMRSKFSSLRRKKTMIKIDEFINIKNTKYIYSTSALQINFINNTVPLEFLLRYLLINNMYSNIKHQLQKNTIELI